MDGPQLGRRSRHPDQPICLRLSHQDVTLFIPQAEQSFVWAGLLPQPWEPGDGSGRGWAKQIGLADQPPAFVSPSSGRMILYHITRVSMQSPGGRPGFRRPLCKPFQTLMGN